MKRIPNKTHRGQRITRNVRRLVHDGVSVSAIVEHFSQDQRGSPPQRSYLANADGTVPSEYRPPRVHDIATLPDGHVYRFDDAFWRPYP